MAPRTSKMVPRMHACLMVNTLDPIEVPKELATSLAPSPKARKKAMIKPTTTIHSQSASTIIVNLVVVTLYGA